MPEYKILICWPELTWLALVCPRIIQASFPAGLFKITVCFSVEEAKKLIPERFDILLVGGDLCFIPKLDGGEWLLNEGARILHALRKELDKHDLPNFFSISYDRDWASISRAERKLLLWHGWDYLASDEKELFHALVSFLTKKDVERKK